MSGTSQIAEHGGLHGVSLQHEMFKLDDRLDPSDVEAFADAARAHLAA